MTAHPNTAAVRSDLRQPAAPDMEVAVTTTCGGFFKLLGSDLYTVRPTFQRDAGPRPIVLDVQYDQRR